MRKCYSKRLEYIIPMLSCDFCNRHLKTGDGLYSVVLTWGNGKTACEDCYNEFKVDWSLHQVEDYNE